MTSSIVTIYALYPCPAVFVHESCGDKGLTCSGRSHEYQVVILFEPPQPAQFTQSWCGYTLRVVVVEKVEVVSCRQGRRFQPPLEVLAVSFLNLAGEQVMQELYMVFFPAPAPDELLIPAGVAERVQAQTRAQVFLICSFVIIRKRVLKVDMSVFSGIMADVSAPGTGSVPSGPQWGGSFTRILRVSATSIRLHPLKTPAFKALVKSFGKRDIRVCRVAPDYKLEAVAVITGLMHT